jgi:hypothetical protein
MALFAMFDALLPLGYTNTTLFDDFTPGAESALIAWADAHGHAWKQREAGPTDGRFVITSVDVLVGGKLGPHITVQRRGS